MMKFQFKVTRGDIERYADVSHDRNPIHLNEASAKAAGFSGEIAHGMLTMAKMVSIVVNECLEPHQFMQSYEFTFLAPVYVDDFVTVQVVPKGKEYRVSGICRGELVVRGIVVG